MRDHLGPTMEKAGLLGCVKLLIWDHNRDLLYERAKVVYDDPKAARYVWGAAFHWYVGDNFENVQLTHDAYLDKQLLFTEGCVVGGPHYDGWEVGECYGHSILQDLNHWSAGWVDWNLVLDQPAARTIRAIIAARQSWLIRVKEHSIITTLIIILAR